MLSLFSLSIAALVFGVLFKRQAMTKYSNGVFLVTLSLFLNYLLATSIMLLLNTQIIEPQGGFLFNLLMLLIYCSTFFFLISVLICIYALQKKSLLNVQVISFLSFLLLLFLINFLAPQLYESAAIHLNWEKEIHISEFILEFFYLVFLSTAAISLIRWNKKMNKDKRVLLFLVFIIMSWGKLLSTLFMSNFTRSFIEFILSLYVMVSLNIVLFLQLYHSKSAGLENSDDNSFNEYLLDQGVSHREKEIANLLVKGKTNKEIAQEMNITVHTVKKHSSSIYSKTNTANRYELYTLFTTIK